MLRGAVPRRPRSRPVFSTQGAILNRCPTVAQRRFKGFGSGGPTPAADPAASHHGASNVWTEADGTLPKVHRHVPKYGKVKWRQPKARDPTAESEKHGAGLQWFIGQQLEIRKRGPSMSPGDAWAPCEIVAIEGTNIYIRDTGVFFTNAGGNMAMAIKVRNPLTDLREPSVTNDWKGWTTWIGVSLYKYFAIWVLIFHKIGLKLGALIITIFLLEYVYFPLWQGATPQQIWNGTAAVQERHDLLSVGMDGGSGAIDPSLDYFPRDQPAQMLADKRAGVAFPQVMDWSTGEGFGPDVQLARSPKHPIERNTPTTRELARLEGKDSPLAGEIARHSRYDRPPMAEDGHSPVEKRRPLSHAVVQAPPSRPDGSSSVLVQPRARPLEEAILEQGILEQAMPERVDG